MNENVSNRPQCSWIPVTDATGRTRMEARWFVPAATMSAPSAA